jgi:hypothetical protein
MAQGYCKICRGFGKVHPIIYPSTPGPECPQSPQILRPAGLQDDTKERDGLHVDRNRTDGKVDYSSLVFCVCRGDKAYKVANPATKHPDIDTGLVEERVYDTFDADKEARFRKSLPFRQSLNELFGPVIPEGGPPIDGKQPDSDKQIKCAASPNQREKPQPREKGYELPKDIQDYQEN